MSRFKLKSSKNKKVNKNINISLAAGKWAYGCDLDCSLEENALMILMQSGFYKKMQGMQNTTATDINSNVTQNDELL